MALGINDDFICGDANEATDTKEATDDKEAIEEYDCIDMTQGVFKAYAFFFHWKDAENLIFTEKLHKNHWVEIIAMGQSS